MTIEVTDISKRFEGHVALDDVSLEVPARIADRAARAERQWEVHASADHRGT